MKQRMKEPYENGLILARDRQAAYSQYLQAS